MTFFDCHIIAVFNFRRIFALFLFFALGLSLTFAAFAGPDKTTIYFYSSETNINNFKSLKMEFDKYLSRFGAYEFQPFSSREAFEQHIKGKEECLVLLSSWHYRLIRKEFSLTPSLTGTRGGEKYHKPVLVARVDAPSIESVITERIASASSIQHTSTVLTQMLRDKFQAKIAKILTVPKDIDALMSVGFGMSKSALTTRNTLDALRTVNPILQQKMKILAEGEESLLLVVAVPKPFAKDAEPIITILKNIDKDPEGKEKIRMLGLDAWDELDPSDKAKLETE